MSNEPFIKGFLCGGYALLKGNCNKSFKKCNSLIFDEKKQYQKLFIYDYRQTV